MNRVLAGKLILSFVLVGGAIMSFALDWSSNHLLNPLWHPHARYHAAILLFLFAGIAATATWSLWRRSQEPSVAFTIAALLSLSYWTPFFYVPLLLPSASYWAGIPGHQPRIGGAILYPNLVVVGLFAALTILGWWLGARPHRGAASTT
jgi:glucan phosphoethanolaminetransferase (alkaline phosphatase superfamily)